MNAADNHLLFEMYKLHAELAEQAASLREGLNKLYSGMVTSIVAASVLLHRVAPDTESVWVLPTLGIVVSLSWILSLHSVTGRLSARHAVLVAASCLCSESIGSECGRASSLTFGLRFAPEQETRLHGAQRGRAPDYGEAATGAR